MADNKILTDSELVTALESFGEKVQLPIKANRRPILIKKLNHLRARVKPNTTPSFKNKIKQNSPSTVPPVSPRSTNSIVNNQHSLNTSFATAPRTSRSYGLETRSGPSNLEALSSDDSDTDYAHNYSVGQTASATNHTRDKSRLSTNVSDNVLRTLRRRTAELPPKRTRKVEVHEQSSDSTGGLGNSSMGSDEEIPVPSPARSRLYPNLRQATSFLSKSDDEKEKFESSDSDLEGSTYMVENKSVNTSFSDVHLRKNPDNDKLSSSLGHKFNSSTSSSITPLNSSQFLQQTACPTRRCASGPLRVQQYKSKYLENLPHILVAIVILFFVVLSVTYAVIHKDYFFSWFSTVNNIGKTDTILSCKDATPGIENCYQHEEVESSLEIIKDLFSQLSIKKGNALCDIEKSGDEDLSILSFHSNILKKNQKNAGQRIYDCCLDHILANAHWNILPLKEDGTIATTKEEVFKLQSGVADMSLWCRLHRSLTTVLFGLAFVVVGIGCILLMSAFIRYRKKQKDKEQEEIHAMVEKIIDMLKEHNEQARNDVDGPPFLVVQHVRDELLPVSVRVQRKAIWDKAVEYIDANESRVQLGTTMLNGEEFSVWYWIQPSLHNGKIWQGQAFGEKNDSNQVIYSPTPCLKIRNMFDTNVESGKNWEKLVKDAILEKCKSVESIVHVYVDVESLEGCVYLKCTSCEAAGKARLALHGWWFDGRLVTVKHLKTEHYHKRWPEARQAVSPLQPSTNDMKSLSQPFYRSSLETL
ncbi:inner nuclear membrane protein Man1-like [Physella acuta]|uniref:inner nuclear membrane protein Man1-like n=1 Tax=Physella acuta TaxID=109671 RepID=UPI0027DB0E01|nr:inner nuclear membrane protein Man1-like [Physella acuta]